ncbi:hypothetical protein [Cupriavidus sp. AcVe19-1a]|uniref:hypothetical protein n=1 Tax=Cupriavidus sp. AcVe19-1a TaxID=2821359 RepID=UPI001AEA662A|nr:hypothetical protein [Cupriavidus sp. AcVe19-1a]MBP0632133.1 hypothetical protein [Cupriavidus sp. AcVe19-1a]
MVASKIRQCAQCLRNVPTNRQSLPKAAAAQQARRSDHPIARAFFMAGRLAATGYNHCIRAGTTAPPA